MEISKINGIRLEKTRHLRERIATLEDAQMIFDFEQKIRATAKVAKDGMPVFSADRIELIREIVTSKDGAIMLYYDGNILVGLFELNIPDDKLCIEKYLVKEIDSKIDYKTVGIYESVSIIPEYRGNGLQRQMAIRMEEIAREKGISVLTGTVHPENSYSYENFLKSGYNILTEKDFSYGHRYIMYKTI